MIRLSARLVRALLAALLVLVALVGLSVAASALAPRTVAGAADLDAQRAAAERAVQRIYAAGIDQLRTTRALKLAIPDAQAAQIEQRYADQLATLRRNALVAIGQAFGQSADQSAQDAAAAESRLAAEAAASASPVLLAPRLYQIVDRMGTLAGQLSDQGIREMTQTTPSAAPSASPAPSVAPRASSTPSPSPTSH